MRPNKSYTGFMFILRKMAVVVSQRTYTRRLPPPLPSDFRVLAVSSVPLVIAE